jgi:hypothetical protein
MPKRKRQIPKLYRDEPGTVVKPLKEGYELVTRPDRSTVVRKTLSRSGKRKHEIAKVLLEHGWEIKRMSGTGWAVHPKRPNLVGASIAAAAALEFGNDWRKKIQALQSTSGKLSKT